MDQGLLRILPVDQDPLRILPVDQGLLRILPCPEMKMLTTHGFFCTETPLGRNQCCHSFFPYELPLLTIPPFPKPFLYKGQESVRNVLSDGALWLGRFAVGIFKKCLCCAKGLECL